MGDRPLFKLRQARDKTGRLITARQIGQRPEPFERPLRCPYCEHEVTAQPEQPRVSTKGKPFTRAAHFALAKEKEEGRTAEHLPGCPLRTDHTVHAIARRSQGLAELRDGGLRLRLVLAATSDSKTPLQPPAGSPLLPPPADPVSLKVRSVEPVLPPAVTSAARIAQLLALYGHDPADVARITVKHPGLREPVPWGDFCYGPAPGDLTRLYRQLAAGAVRHPVAVHGQVTQIRTTDKATSCRIATRVPTGLPGPRDHAEVYLRADPHHRALLEPLTEGAHVLALAAPDITWKLWKPASSRLGHQVVLWPAAHWQVAFWDVDDAGLPGPPRSPSPLSEPPRPRPRRRPAPDRSPARSSRAASPSLPPPGPPTGKTAASVTAVEASPPLPPPAAAAAAENVASPGVPPLPTEPPRPVTPPPAGPPVIPPPPTTPPRLAEPAPETKTKRRGLLTRWRRR
ncbi:hypothetical protein AB0M66_23195 [Streptomyces albidoflavus]|uniref:hypothetical protein n=1 Tax=Streptomyces albidoflavus TaxID=1886 RepID=UPI0034344C12